MSKTSDSSGKLGCMATLFMSKCKPIAIKLIIMDEGLINMDYLIYRMIINCQFYTGVIL